MGQWVEQAALFHEFRLEERVPADHLSRRVDAVLGLGFVREHVAERCSTMGRSSIRPELMVRMARPSATCLASGGSGASARRWTSTSPAGGSAAPGLRGGCPTAPPSPRAGPRAQPWRFRDSDLMREVFERLVEQCLAAGLASADHVAVDGSGVQASADRHRRVAGESELPRKAAARAVRECLDEAVPDLEGSSARRPSTCR